MININKKYRTISGHEVRIYAVDGNGPYPVHGAIKTENVWSMSCWDDDGDYYCSVKNLNLVEVKPRIQQTIYLNIYDGYTSISSTEKVAEERADCGICARVKVDIDVEEGHGLT